MTFTENMLIKALLRLRHRRHFCLPRYTPKNWWECDLFELTKAGFFREYEVKLTRSDFFNDKKKRHWKRGDKHAGIGSPSGPNRFWYVFPEGLLKLEEIPDWAGALEIRVHGNYRLYDHEIREAPVLHKQKADPEIRKHAEGICYWRFLHLFLKHAR